MSYDHDPEAYPDQTPVPPIRPLPDGLTLPRWTATPEAGIIPASGHDVIVYHEQVTIDAGHNPRGWYPRNEAEQLEADIEREVHRLRREARERRITKEAKKRIRKEGK